MKKALFLTLFLGLMIVSSLLGVASQLEVAPPNPAFENYLKEVQSGGGRPTVTSGGYFLGLLPNPVDLSHTRGLTIYPKSLLEFPASYDLRTLGRVTPVKDQGSCGSCWTFATMGSLESWLLSATGESWDFSENNLKECHGFDWGPCAGGNSFVSTAYLTRRDGPISEADDPYFDYATGCRSGLPARKYLREALMIPDRSGPLDNDNLKQAVMDYGAIYTSMYWGSAYYNAVDCTYYYTGSADSNHAVALVGWDDNKVISAAPEPGAWIVRNSWGTAWGEGGYFYVSYYDSNLGEGNAAFIEAEDPDSSTTYQYDPLGWVGSLGYPSGDRTTAWGVNVFTASWDGTLTAVAFYAATTNTTYEINIKQGGPDGGVLHSQIGSATYPGYHRIDLTSPVSLYAGDTFSVAVKLTTPGYNYPVPVEYALPGYSSSASADPGESYISHDGSVGSWYDVTNWHPTCNVCIKAVVESTDTQILFQHRYDRTGWRIVSFPCIADPIDPTSQLGDDLGVDPLHAWDPSIGDYVTSSTIELGDAYWAWFENADTLVDLTGYELAAFPQSITCEAPGWHMIGPAYQTAWSDVQIAHGGETLSIDQAAEQGWIRPFVIRYDPSLSPDYYYWVGYEEAILTPWEGYWFMTLVPNVTLQFPHAPTSPASVLALDRPRALGFRPVEAGMEFPPPVPGLSSPASQVQVVLVPNPVTGEGASFQVRGICPCSVQSLQVAIHDLAGELVWRGESRAPTLPWHAEDQDGLPLANGIYLFKASVLVGGNWLRTDLQSFLILR